MNFLKTIVAAGLVAASTSAFAADITGAGSTFIFPVLSKWADAYKKESGAGVNYQSIGSGAGIKQIQAKTVTFGATDAPLKAEQLEKDGFAQWPMIMGAIVPVVNIDGIKAGDMVLDGDTLAKIYLGTITKWDDAAIKKLNPKLNLPSAAISVVHRADGSGTTFNFTDYLSKVSAEWNTKVGKGSAVNWPTGVGGKGSEGVSGTVKQNPGTIGYVEMSYAIQNKIPFARVQNRAGNFITPTIASVTAAANVQIPPDSKVSLTNTDAQDGYPISGFSWVIIYKEQKYNDRSQERATKLLKLLSWMIHDGQQYSGALNYAPLSPAAVNVGDAILKSATYDGKPILQ